MTEANEKYYLVKYEDNYADEFDVHSTIVLDQRQLDFLNVVIDKVEYFTFRFGTNESIEYESPSQVRSALEIEEITIEEFNVLKKFGLASLGKDFVGRVIESYTDDMEDEEFELIEDESRYFFNKLFEIKYGKFND